MPDYEKLIDLFFNPNFKNIDVDKIMNIYDKIVEKENKNGRSNNFKQPSP